MAGQGLFEMLRYIMNAGNLDDFQDFALYMRREKGMSSYNAAFIYFQRPGAIALETEACWEKNYGRHIRDDAVPVFYIRPYGPVGVYYEYSDTYGEACYLDKVTERPKIQMMNAKDKAYGDLYEMVKMMLTKLGIEYGEKKFGGGQGGQSALLKSPIRI